jgi:hypothetical protein
MIVSCKLNIILCFDLVSYFLYAYFIQLIHLWYNSIWTSNHIYNSLDHTDPHTPARSDGPTYTYLGQPETHKHITLWLEPTYTSLGHPSPHAHTWIILSCTYLFRPWVMCTTIPLSSHTPISFDTTCTSMDHLVMHTPLLVIRSCIHDVHIHLSRSSASYALLCIVASCTHLSTIRSRVPLSRCCHIHLSWLTGSTCTFWDHLVVHIHPFSHLVPHRTL